MALSPPHRPNPTLHGSNHRLEAPATVPGRHRLLRTVAGPPCWKVPHRRLRLLLEEDGAEEEEEASQSHALLRGFVVVGVQRYITHLLVVLGFLLLNLDVLHEGREKQQI
ncbi:unnamed protein product [Miscanthus lutarioriparius]|uniref:Uncharacterized protein n=1 Tax=Miscanthus lutarioriparius TaxID=422564 RepID=A0A811N4V6_9POAL|nr:unnamed protein product [Miscanthus lutarioriparius]